MIFEYLLFRIQEISYLTTEEWVNLKASLRILEDKEFICENCLSKYSNRKDSEQMTERFRQQKNCYKPGQHIPMNQRLEGLEFSWCMGNFFDKSTMYYMELYDRYEKGFLPYPGELREQPAKIMQVFSHISEYRNNQRLRIMQEQKAKASGR